MQLSTAEISLDNVVRVGVAILLSTSVFPSVANLAVDLHQSDVAHPNDNKAKLRKLTPLG